VVTTAQVCEAAGMVRSTFQGWVERGLVVPEARTNAGMKFGVTQAVGVCVAKALFKAERGCTSTHVRKVVRAFSSMTEAELAHQIDNGNTHFVMLNGGKVVLAPGAWDWPDVKEAFDKVSAKMKEE
jgi:hypothetical protein